jgi:3-polyprenyl-4-hydroxybenzoate decarboxylase
VQHLRSPAEMIYHLRRAGLPLAACWGVMDNHWWVVAVDPDWPERISLTSAELAHRVGEVVFDPNQKLGWGIPKLVLVENDIDISDPRQVIWAFASRAHPSLGEVHFASEPYGNLAVYLDQEERFTFHAQKVVHNCLLADRFPADQRLTAADFAHNWSAEMQQHVIDNWHAYGYK